MSKARIIDLISEGEIEGLIDGLNSIYVNQTPLTTSGVANFSGLVVGTRYGTQHQDPLPGFPSTENGIPINVELRSDTPWIRSFPNLDLTAVRVTLDVTALKETSLKTGDTNGYRVEYAIDVSADDGPYTTVVSSAFDGKTNSTYQRSHDIRLPPATTSRNIRVRRITANANLSNVSDTTMIESVTEIVDGLFSYPNSALIGLEIDSTQFQGIPTRNYAVKGIKVQIPNNYNTTDRTYNGAWNGGFVTAWTDNPAWIFYALASNPRFGCGTRIPAGWLDKWALYTIAQYCDELVPDGFGGQEPRFTCNAYIQDREGAFDLLQKLAAVFQGMAYYMSGSVFAVADMPKDVSAVYSNSDVENGTFNYSGSPRSTRYTVALVGWSDFNNFWQQNTEYVEDADAIARYGYIETQISAFGCSSQGQAHRVGRWALLTSQVETETCTFTLGLKGLKSKPGDVIQIADQDLIGEYKGGLISASTLNTITTDCDFTAKVGDSLTVMLPTGAADVRTISNIDGRKITVSQNFTAVPQVQGSWGIDGDVKLQTYRVLSVTEKDGVTFDLKCVQYEPSKFDAIANGTKLDTRPITAIPPGVQTPPASVTISQRVVVSQGIANTIATIAWPTTPNAVAYEGQWKKDNGEWMSFARTGSTSIELPNIYTGNYLARVRAINAFDIASIYTNSVLTALTGKNTPPPAITSLTATPLLWGISIQWGFPASGSEDALRTELWYSDQDDLATATKLDFAYPQDNYKMMGLKAGATLYFWARIVDKSGNYGPYYPGEGAGVEGDSSIEANDYLDAIRNEVITTDLAKQLEAESEATSLMVNAEKYLRLDDTDSLGAHIDTVQQTLSDETSALASQLTALSARVDTNAAAVATEQTARADQDSALAQEIDTKIAQVNSDLTALITTEQTARVDATTSLSDQINTVSATAGGNTAAIQAESQARADLNGKVASAFTLKSEVTVDNVRYFAGMGLGVEPDTDGTGYVSQILLQADRLALLNTNTSGVVVPFAVEGGQTFINSAVIQDASIDTAKIKNASITYAKIGVAQIGNAHIADAQITTAKIVNAAITNAKIANAAITNAKIADATITNAKIGTAEIDTLKLANGSVTVSVSYSGSGTFSFTLKDAASCLVIVPAGKVVIDGSTALTVQAIYMEYWASSGSGESNNSYKVSYTIPGAAMLNLGAGTHSVVVSQPSGALAGTPSVTILSAMR